MLGLVEGLRQVSGHVLPRPVPAVGLHKRVPRHVLPGALPDPVLLLVLGRADLSQHAWAEGTCCSAQGLPRANPASVRPRA